MHPTNSHPRGDKSYPTRKSPRLGRGAGAANAGRARGERGASAGRARGEHGASTGRARGEHGASTERARGEHGASAGRPRGEHGASTERARSEHLQPRTPHEHAGRRTPHEHAGRRTPHEHAGRRTPHEHAGRRTRQGGVVGGLRRLAGAAVVAGVGRTANGVDLSWRRAVRWLVVLLVNGHDLRRFYGSCPHGCHGISPPIRTRRPGARPEPRR